MDQAQPPGRRWFLSYHSPDHALAQELKSALEANDTAARVFFAPAHLRAGGFWTAALAAEIAQADAFVLLVGEKGVGNWQVLEYYEALDRRVQSASFPLVVVLLKGQLAPGLPFMRQLHWIETASPASEQAIGRLLDAVVGKEAEPGELWRHTSPYRGLAAMDEKDSDYFFGREAETIAILKALAVTRGKLPVLMGSSGVGKSSLARAGVLAALKRQAWPEGQTAAGAWPQPFEHSRRWCFLTMRPEDQPLRALVATFFDTWQLDPTDPTSAEKRNAWETKLNVGQLTIRNLVEATEARYRDLGRDAPPCYFLYIDQGEELYTRSAIADRCRFSELLAEALADRRLRLMMSLRSDFLGELQGDEPLYRVHRQIDVPRLNEARLSEVVKRPAELLSARFESVELADIITRRTAEESASDAGALPLLSYALDDMWKQMVQRGDGVLRLGAKTFELGAVLAERADGFVQEHPGCESALRRIFALRLATMREGSEPTRRRADRSEFTDKEWRLVAELAGHPYRLLVTAAPEIGEPYAEVAHEAIFRRWQTLREWIVADPGFLRWRDEADRRRRVYENNGQRDDDLLQGYALQEGRGWLANKRDDLAPGIVAFVEASIASAEREAAERAATQLAHQRQVAFAQSLQLAVLARTLVKQAPETALLIAGEAIRLNHNVHTDEVVREAVAALPNKVARLGVDVVHAAFAPGGEIQTLSGAGQADRFDCDGKLLRSVAFQNLKAMGGAFSSDGSTVFVVDASGKGHSHVLR
jgi:conflict system STAND superfamily ATPase/TIR domain-containing protein